MVDYVVAVDCDGVLRSYRQGVEVIPNEFIRSFIITLSKFRNVKVVAWSARGKNYADDVVFKCGLRPYIKEIYNKGDIEPDIAIDDAHEFSMGIINLIYNERQREEAW